MVDISHEAGAWVEGGEAVNHWYHPYPRPCENAFEALCANDPGKAIELLNDGLEPTMLTFAAEIAGKRLNGELVINSLIALLDHGSITVVEGALYGLSYHNNNAAVMSAIKRVAEHHECKIIRDIALDYVEFSSHEKTAAN